MQVKVVSLNIWDGGRLFDEMIDFCRQQAADIYLFQEVFHNEDHTAERRFRAYQEIQLALELEHALFAPTYIEVEGEHKHLQGNAVMSRFPLNPVSVQFYDEPFQEVISKYRPMFPFIPRNLQHVLADVEGTPLHVLNTQGIWGEEGFDTPRRIEMGKIIANEAAQVGAHVPLVLAGDFNVDPDTQTMHQVEVQLKSVFQRPRTTSFNLQQKDLKKHPGYARAVVDMMFVSDAVKVLEYDSPQVNVSDHLPLVATLQF